MVLKKTHESLLDSKEIKLVNPKGNQPRIFIGRTGAEAEDPILWPCDAKSRLTEKDPAAEKTKVKRRSRRQKMRWLDGVTNLMDLNLSKCWEVRGQRSLACCRSWVCKESDVT